MIGLVMWPSFQKQVKLALSKVPHKWYYEVATIHAVFADNGRDSGTLYRHSGRHERFAAVAAVQTLEVVDAHRASALGDGSAQWRGNVLRMVCGTIPGNASQNGVNCFTKLLDLNMLVMTGGRERTETEFRTLLDASGYKLTKIVHTMAPQRVIEAVPN